MIEEAPQCHLEWPAPSKVSDHRPVTRRVEAVDDEARTFSEHHDFVALPGESRRLVMKLSTAAKALGMPWP